MRGLPVPSARVKTRHSEQVRAFAAGIGAETGFVLALAALCAALMTLTRLAGG